MKSSRRNADPLTGRVRQLCDEAYRVQQDLAKTLEEAALLRNRARATGEVLSPDQAGGALSIFEEIAYGFLCIDKHWRVAYWNPTAAKLLSSVGKPKPSVLFHLWTAFPELRASDFYAQLHRVSALHEPIEFQEFLKPLQRWLEVRCYPFNDGLSVFLLDITQHKLLEDEVATTGRQFRALFDGALDAVLVLDDERRCIDANPAACQLFGLPRGRLAGLRIEELYGASAKEAWMLMWQEFVKLGRQTGELRVQVASGAVREVEYASRANFLPGRHLSVLRDITSRKQAERHLRLQHAMVQALAGCRDLAELRLQVCRALAETGGWQAAGVWEAGPSGDVLHCVEFRCEPVARAADWEALFREPTIRRGEGLPGRVWANGEAAWVADLPRQNHSRRDWLAVQAGLHTAFALPIPVQNSTFGVIELFGREAEPFGADLLPIMQAMGRQIGQFIERKEAERHRDELLAREQAARAEAEKALRAREVFLATISHELRTPLTAILGYSRLLRTREVDRETQTTALEVIDRNARAVVQLVEDILDHSRISSGKLRLEKIPVDLVPLVSAAVNSFRPAAAASSIHLRDAPEAEPLIVLGDGSRLQQVVSNLLSNAVKFTPENGRIEVRLRRRGSHGDIIVSDTGIGISPEFQPRVFEAFSQADPSSSQSRAGLGLGLSLVRELVKLHCGEIVVESDGRGKGTTFTVTFPLCAAAPPARAPARDLSNPTAAPLRNLRILAVDDDPDTLEFVGFALRGYGAEVVAVDSVRRAVQSLESFRPQVILTDIAMPREDGYDLIRHVRASKKQRQIPVVALTAYASTEERERVLAEGFAACVPKPVDPADLATAICGLVRPPKARRISHDQIRD